MAKRIDAIQNAGTPEPSSRPDGLYEMNSKLEERSPKIEFMFERSAYQKAKMNPLGGVAVAGFMDAKKKSRDDGAAQTGGGSRLLAGKSNSSPRAARIKEHGEVVGSDGHHVGTVDHACPDYLRRRKKETRTPPECTTKFRLIGANRWTRTEPCGSINRRAKPSNNGRLIRKTKRRFKDSLPSATVGGNTPLNKFG